MARYLISSLEIRQDENVDEAWSELAEKRFEELVSGKVQSVYWEEIKKMIRHYKESERERLDKFAEYLENLLNKKPIF